MPDALRLNLGAGAFPLAGYVSVDADPACAPDVVATVPPIPYPDGSVAAIYCGHLLEHYDYDGGQALLRDCARVLAPGGHLTVVVPDMYAILRRYVRGAKTTQAGPAGERYAVADLDDICRYWLFSDYQPSPHRWAYDAVTLVRALERAGLRAVQQVDRYHDARLSDPGWWQLGYEVIRP